VGKRNPQTRRRNPQTRRRRVGRPPKPILLPECNLEFARGIYTGEGTFWCAKDDKKRRATPAIAVRMTDWEALKKLEACFGTSVGKYVDVKGERSIVRVGTKALELAEKLSVTKQRKDQIETVIKRCREYWKKGYSNRIP